MSNLQQRERKGDVSEREKRGDGRERERRGDGRERKIILERGGETESSNAARIGGF